MDALPAVPDSCRNPDRGVPVLYRQPTKVPPAYLQARQGASETSTTNRQKNQDMKWYWHIPLVNMFFIEEFSEWALENKKVDEFSAILTAHAVIIAAIITILI